jgi:hypothetical protein
VEPADSAMSAFGQFQRASEHQSGQLSASRRGESEWFQVLKRDPDSAPDVHIKSVHIKSD